MRANPKIDTARISLYPVDVVNFHSFWGNHNQFVKWNKAFAIAARPVTNWIATSVKSPRKLRKNIKILIINDDFFAFSCFDDRHYWPPGIWITPARTKLPKSALNFCNC